MKSFSGFLRRNRTEFSVLLAFLALLFFFIIANPKVFLSPQCYSAVFVTLPLTLILTTAMVFMIVSGEIDLSFPSVVGLGSFVFAFIFHKTGSPLLALLVALLAGLLVGIFNGLLVARIGLSSLVATIGVNFLIRGAIMIATQGYGSPLVALKDTLFHKVFVGKIGLFPVQMLWGIGFVVGSWLIFNRHKFGAHVGFVGDNLQAARMMGINVERVKTSCFMLVGLSAAFVGVLVDLINLTFWPTAGDGYLLVILSAIFLGGTPTWGGVGTIIGAAIGALILSFIETGIIASGLTGFYTQFFYGLILIVALISHKLGGPSRAK
ncbi:MAG: ABC transporter permease [Candidatus Caldatribacterium sp.]|nr:ABC transporter permease [Candidatus Caldatribacterium sp.]